jgi:hypothetical protein
MKLLILFIFLISQPVFSADKDNSTENRDDKKPYVREPKALPVPSDDDDEAEEAEQATADPYPKYIDISGSNVQSKESRSPAAVQPQKYIDTDLGIACYYLMAPTFTGVTQTSSPAISCVKIDANK